MSYQNIGAIINLGKSANARGLQIALTSLRARDPEQDAAALAGGHCEGYGLQFRVPASAAMAVGDKVTLDIDAISGTAILRLAAADENVVTWKLRGAAGGAKQARFGGTMYFRIGLRPGLLKLLGAADKLKTVGDVYSPEQEVVAKRVMFLTGVTLKDVRDPAPLPCDKLGRKDARDRARAALK